MNITTFGRIQKNRKGLRIDKMSKGTETLDRQQIVVRNPVISISRVLGMIFIITCHIVKYYSFIPLHESLGEFFNCGVIMFLFISGYLYGGKEIKQFKKWYAKRIATVSMPAVIVSMIVIIFLLVLGENISLNSIVAYCLDLEGILFLNWNLTFLFKEILSLGPLWFTTIIMICYLTVPLWQYIFRKVKTSIRFIMLFIAIGIVVSILASTICSLFYFIYFAIGYICGKIKFLDNVGIKKFSVYTFAFWAAIAGRLILQKFVDETFIYQNYVSVSHFVVGTWFVVAIAFINNRNSLISKAANSKVIRVLDNYSYYIFLVHGVFCMGVFNVYAKMKLPLATLTFCLFTVLASITLKVISKTISRLITSKT